VKRSYETETYSGAVIEINICVDGVSWSLYPHYIISFKWETKFQTRTKVIGKVEFINVITNIYETIQV
jgi:hypothetical protein